MALENAFAGDSETVSEDQIFDDIHAKKYRQPEEDFEGYVDRFTRAVGGDGHLKHMLLHRRFLPAGRVQSALGSPSNVTAMNCFVSGTIEDSLDGIFDKVKEAARVFKMGGGIGYDFTTIRPRGSAVDAGQHVASGPVSFMHVFDAACATMMSAGARRGAQMGILRIDHPDILEFIRAKRVPGALTNFNLSVAVTDAFMMALQANATDAVDLWDEIMRSVWDHGEPGVVFISQMNRRNNLYYCETIAATNPCAEQPLPPYGACLLGSMNLAAYIGRGKTFLYEQLLNDVTVAVRTLDTVIDVSKYPLPQHEAEMKAKRRIGLGVTGLANAAEILGMEYAGECMLLWTDTVLEGIKQAAYRASVELAKEKGPFPLFDRGYCYSPFIGALPRSLQYDISHHGIRNSHLISFAPAGTISIAAGNVSGGIEPPFSLVQHRRDVGATISDFAYREHGIRGRVSNDCSVEEHLAVLEIAARHSDSGVSKTINVSSSSCSYDDFKLIYENAWLRGIKAVAAFRSDGLREGVMCAVDPLTGVKSCAD